MIVDERIITFINSMDTENSEILETIEQEALAADVPIIRREMQSFLEVLLLMKKPMRVLEVGTAVGVSALLMSDYLPEGGPAFRNCGCFLCVFILSLLAVWGK